MDKLEQYRNLVKQIILRNAEYAPSLGQVESVPVFDEHRDHYFLVDYGWNRTGRVHSVILHLHIKNGKVWIERDGTEEGIAHELLEVGIPKEDIVLAFYRPERRAITEFAVA
ncbi:MAG: XisI protein [Chloroflexi bacterium]|nr:MAG: XisI protein [Chloroflexota bacterium]